MEPGDRDIIAGYFKRLAESEKPAKDLEAETLIVEKAAAIPGALYYLTQAAIVSEHALAEAQNRIQQLEWEASRKSGGMLGSLFGGSGGAGRPPAPVHAPGYRPGMFDNTRSSPWGGQGRPSFMGGAMQMMMGVAGGMLLGNLLGQMFGSNEAAAAEMPAEEMTREQPSSGWDAGGGGGDSFE
jgi:uncharacterized protein